MPLNIKDEAIHAKARELARLSGESITRAVGQAIDARLKTLRHAARGRRDERLAERLMEICRRSGGRPILDRRSEDEILGYDPATGRPD